MSLEFKKFEGKNKSRNCFLWLHGYGASMDDLAPLKDVIKMPFDCDWVFLNGPLSIQISFFMEGRAWFPLDMNRLEEASQSGSTAEVFKNSIPPGYPEAMDQVRSFIDKNLSEYDNVFLGGFSQGSMVASRIALTHEKVKMLVLFSTTYFDDDGWKNFDVTNKDLLGFQSHGVNDQVLPVDAAQKMGDFMQSNIQDHHSLEFAGGHEIPPQIIMELNNKISDWFESKNLKLGQ